jgi:hypothetical protein
MPLQFLLVLGLIFRWTLFWDCLGLRGGAIAYLLWWIIFLRWNTLYHVSHAETTAEVWAAIKVILPRNPALGSSSLGWHCVDG